MTIGLWGLPLMVTVVSFLWLIFKEPESGNMPGIGVMLNAMALLILNLMVWLGWALFK
jgi:hypothetical protein